MKIIVNVFTDPMMGLSYESEPILEKLKCEYAEIIEFEYVMSLLVRDVKDFMTAEEKAMEPETGIAVYCKRLAKIYKSEESIGHLPMNMEGFCLFDHNHPSSKPLNLAYEAAKLTDPQKADAFLTALRHATVLECVPTTHLEEILKIVQRTGIDVNVFLQHYLDGSAENELNKDLLFTKKMGITSLPAYLIQYGQKAVLLQSFHYQDFKAAIEYLVHSSKKPLRK